jgi:hypothetical protein
VQALDNLRYTHGGYFGFSEALSAFVRHARTSADFDPALRAILSVAPPLPENGHYGMKSLENDPSVAALGHVAELMAKFNGSIFRQEIFDLCLHGLPQPSADLHQLEANEVPSPRAIEWDIYVDPAVGLIGEALVRRTAITHGSVSTIIREALRLNNFERLLRSSPTPVGWLVKYARMLLLLIDPQKLGEGTDGEQRRIWHARALKDEEWQTEDILDFMRGVWPKLFWHINLAASAQEGGVSNRDRAATPPLHFRVVLDVKTRRASPALLAHLVPALNAIGIVVEAVGSFSFHQVSCVLLELALNTSTFFFDLAAPESAPDLLSSFALSCFPFCCFRLAHNTHACRRVHTLQLDGLDSVRQIVNGAWLPSPVGLRFFHTAGDVVAAAHSGSLTAQAEYFFNAGSLVRVEAGAVVPKQQLLQRLEDIVQTCQIELGLYVQEYAVHPKALAAIVLLCNQQPKIFKAGMCISAVNGICQSPEPGLNALAAVEPHEKVSTGLGLQKLVGHSDSGSRFFWW